jgi:hypothetical protein
MAPQARKEPSAEASPRIAPLPRALTAPCDGAHTRRPERAAACVKNLSIAVMALTIRATGTPVSVNEARRGGVP